MMSPARRVAFAILLVAFFLRAGLSFMRSPKLERYFPDSVEFDLIGRNLNDGKGFLARYGYQHVRPPLYPLFVAGAYRIHQSVRCIRLLQALLDTGTVALLMLLARRLGLSRRAALVSGALYAVNPYSCFFSTLVLSESLSGTLTLACLYFWACGLAGRSGEGISPYHALLCGLFAGLSCLTRTVGLIPLSLCVAIWWIWGWGNWLSRLRSAAIVFVVAVLCLSPWIIRNRDVYGEFVLTAPNGGETLYYSFREEADGGVPRVVDPSRLPDELNLAVRDRHFRDLAIQWIKLNPTRAVLLSFEKLKRFMSPVPNFEMYSHFPYSLVSVYEAPYLVLGFFGLWVAFRRRSLARFLIPFVLFFPALHMVLVGSIRYRMPIEPMLAIFIPFSLAHFSPRCKGRCASAMVANL